MSTTTLAILVPGLVAALALITREVGAIFDRRSTRALASANNAHDERLRRAERLYDDKKKAYGALMRWAHVEAQRVTLFAPIYRDANMPEPPKQPPAADFDNAQIQMSIFSSAELQAAFRDYVFKINAFFTAVEDLGRVPIAERATARVAVGTARTEALAVYERLRELVKSDLAG